MVTRKMAGVRESLARNKSQAQKNQLIGWLNRWLRGPDSNRRPSGYEPDELPGCSTPRQRLRILRPAASRVNTDDTNGARDRKIMKNR